jgi:uncharacterized membrane protein YqaE (UPF0057 family)
MIDSRGRRPGLKRWDWNFRVDDMRYVIALFLPWLAFFTMGKPFQGIICLILQLTLIGWLPAAIWAFVSISNYYADQRAERVIEAVERARNG